MRFNFTMAYRPGSRNKKADALSRIYLGETEKGESEPLLPVNCCVRAIQ